jgi:hypothetical protein
VTDANPKNANAHRKQRETSIHRVIDRYRTGQNDEACMLEIRMIVGRTIMAEAKKGSA